MRRLATVLWLAGSTCAAAPAGGEIHTSPPTPGAPVRLTIHSPADFATATAAMSTLAWGDASAGARLEVVITTGDYGGQSLQLKQDPNAPNPVALSVRGEGHARVTSLALDLEAAQVEVADLLFEGTVPSYALKVRTPGAASLARLSFVDAVVGGKGGPAHGGVLLLEASSATATATLTDCAFVGGSAQQPVPMITLGAQPASMFERVTVEGALLADAGFPTLVSDAAVRVLTVQRSVLILRPTTTLVSASAPWAQLALADVTVVIDDPARMFVRGGAAAAIEPSTWRVGWPGASSPPSGGATTIAVDAAKLDAAVAGLRAVLRAGPLDLAAVEAAAGLR